MSRRRLQITSVFIVFTFILFGFQNCSNKKTSFFSLNEAGSLWTETVTENINKIIFDNSGSENLLICLQGSAGYWLTGNQSSAVAKLTNTGGRLSSFNTQFEVTSNCNDIAVDSRNRIVVSHSVQNGGRSKNIIRYNSNGVLDNSYSMANLNAEYYQFKGLGVDSKDNVLFWTDINHIVNNNQYETAYYGPVLMVAP